ADTLAQPGRPELGRLLVTPRQEGPAVGAEDRRLDFAGELQRRPRRLARGRVPQFDRPVGADRKESPAVGAEGHRVDAPLAGGGGGGGDERGLAPPAPPERAGAAPGPRQETARVGADRRDRELVPAEVSGRRRLAGRRVPRPGPAVPALQQGAPAVAGDGQGE